MLTNAASLLLSVIPSFSRAFAVSSNKALSSNSLLLFNSAYLSINLEKKISSKAHFKLVTYNILFKQLDRHCAYNYNTLRTVDIFILFLPAGVFNENWAEAQQTTSDT